LRAVQEDIRLGLNGAVLHRRLVLMNATVFYVNSENRLRFPAIFKTAS